MLDNIKQVLLHVIMILIAAIVLVPVKSLPVMAESYNVWVGEKQVSDENKNDVLGDGTVIFTPQDGETPATLTLNGGTISKFKNIPTENNAIIGAKSMDLIIHVTGNTTLQHEGIEPGKNGGISLIGSSNETLTITVDKGITLSTNGIHCRAAEGDSSGIYTNGSLVINGKGTINATGGSGHGSRGIEANNITIENGIITAKANPNATSIGSYGIYCKNILTISGGELIASGSTMAIWQSSTINSALNGIGYTVLNATEGTSFDSGQGIPGDSLRLYKKIHFLPNPSVSHTVTFKVKKVRTGETVDIPIVRELINMPAIEYVGMLNDTTGYILQTKFTEGVSQEIRNAYFTLKAQGMKKLVLDLRGNGGGLMNEAVKIVSLFVPKGSLTTRRICKSLPLTEGR